MLFFRDNITYKNLEFDKEQINILKYIIENSDKLNKEFKNDKSLKCNIYLKLLEQQNEIIKKSQLLEKRQ
ncbi:hypothetical protein UT300002_30250 [Clostridium perfringens]